MLDVRSKNIDVTLFAIQAVLERAASVMNVPLWVEGHGTRPSDLMNCPPVLPQADLLDTANVEKCGCGRDVLVVPITFTDNTRLLIRSGHLPNDWKWVSGSLHVENRWDSSLNVAISSLPVTACFLSVIVGFAYDNAPHEVADFQKIFENPLENVSRICASLRKNYYACADFSSLAETAPSFHRVPDLLDFLQRVPNNALGSSEGLTDIFQNLTSGRPVGFNLLGLDGVATVKPHSFQDICRKIRGYNPQPCVLSDLTHLWSAILLSSLPTTTTRVFSYQCPCNITEQLCPVLADGLGIGAVFAGQVVESESQYAAVIQCLQSVPGLSPEEINQVCSKNTIQATSPEEINHIHSVCIGLADFTAVMYREWSRVGAQAELRAELIQAASVSEIDVFLDQACRLVPKFTPLRSCSIWLASGDRLVLRTSTVDTMYVRTQPGTAARAVPVASLIGNAWYSIGEGLTGDVAQRANGWRYEPAAMDTAGWSGKYSDTNQEAQFLGFRLERDNTLYGVLRAGRLQGQAQVTQDDIRLLRTFTDELSIAIHEKKMTSESDERAELFRMALTETGHEFRSPLQNILSQVMIAKEELPPHSKIELRFARIVEEVYRARTQMDNSVLFGAQSECNFVESPFGPLFQAVADEYSRRAAERNIRIIVWDSAKHLPPIFMDSVRIRQVLTNLVDNAVKWSFNGEHINLRGYNTESHVRFFVEDRGTGVPEKQEQAILRNVFVRKVVTDKKRFIAGSGIGLKVAARIIEEHGGWIEVSSKPFLADPKRQGPEHGHTVTFAVTLPKEGPSHGLQRNR